MCQNRIVFKQFMAEGAIDVVQLDARRLGGVNQVLAVLLMAAKYDLPVCPQPGGVGLCAYVQPLAMIDYLCFAGTREGHVAQYNDHLHEPFSAPYMAEHPHPNIPHTTGHSTQKRQHT